MAGGIGSRFWPLSRTSRPKQFLDILGTGKSLLQQTFERMVNVCPVENILIVTNTIYKDLVHEQIPNIPADNVLLEPMKRNTAPCIAYANYKILKKTENANIIVAPSDHLILNEEKFFDDVRTGLKFVENQDVLLTLGIKPNRPETGYGYIQANTDKPVENNTIKGLSEVKTFTEKPNYEMAKVFFESGEFYWNSGLFIWSLQSIIKAFDTHLPEVNTLFKKDLDAYNSPYEADFINKIYSECKNISIDFGIMEKAENVFVLCTDFGWSDLGTWGSLYENSMKDKDGNLVKGEKRFLYDTTGCIVDIPREKLIVIQGLNDYIVAESNNILLICKKQDEQMIRKFVNDVKMDMGDQFV